MDELKPCPFCGEPVKIDTYEIDSPFTFTDNGFEIRCHHCNIVFREHSKFLIGIDTKRDEKLKKKLAQRWNTRKGSESIAKYDVVLSYPFSNTIRHPNSDETVIRNCKKCSSPFGRILHYRDGGFRISCPICSYCTEKKQSKEEAVSAWNQR